MSQVVIKAILIVFASMFAVSIFLPIRGARNQAIRHLGLLVFLGVVAYAILFPSTVNDLAQLVGVGRGADLLLYGLIIVFVGHLLASARRRRTNEKHVTQLTREIALQNPRKPE